MNRSGIRIALALAAVAAISGTLRSCDTRGGTHETAAAPEGTTFAVGFPTNRSSKALDGRVILLLSRDFSREPLTHVAPNEPLASPYLFGLTVDGLAPGTKAVLDDTAFGWPATHLSAIPAGDYFVQAVLNRSGAPGQNRPGSR
jgi:hypothetical protein